MTIQPRTLKGFRDFLPDDMRIRQRVFDTFRRIFEKYGFEPLETPVLEYADILMGKYGEEAEGMMYRFTDRGDRDVAMKYDLTVPASRVLAQYRNDLPLPFKRYQIQPVWRAENTQKGRFREFYQCDADTFGASSPTVEAEYVQMGIEAIHALGFTNVEVRLNNRKIIDGMVSYAGGTKEQFYAICIAVDKLDKIGAEGVAGEMRKKGIPEDTIEKVMSTIAITGTNDFILDELSRRLGGVAEAEEGIREMREMFRYLRAAGVEERYWRFDPTIIRGLSYYTGPVWEFAIPDGGVGSVGGGGRYDKLVGTYLGQDVPAAGGSFGIERLIEIIKDRGLADTENAIKVLVTVFSPETAERSVMIARKLRMEGYNVMLYPEAGTKLGTQIKYADKKGIPVVAIAGEDELNKGIYKLKDMKTGEETTYDV
jgi:histidyl-tRNA synthetase